MVLQSCDQTDSPRLLLDSNDGAGRATAVGTAEVPELSGVPSGIVSGLLPGFLYYTVLAAPCPAAPAPCIPMAGAPQASLPHLKLPGDRLACEGLGK